MESFSALIDAKINGLRDWRGDTLAYLRQLIHEADPGIEEDCKWIKPSNPSGVPIWSHDGIVCTGESYKGVVKLTFAHGASIPDPKKLFNSSLEGNARRAIDIREGEQIDEAAFKKLVRAAVAANSAAGAQRAEKKVRRNGRVRLAISHIDETLQDADPCAAIDSCERNVLHRPNGTREFPCGIRFPHVERGAKEGCAYDAAARASL